MAEVDSLPKFIASLVLWHDCEPDYGFDNTSYENQTVCSRRNDRGAKSANLGKDPADADGRWERSGV